ncbi:hypothetical protein RUND412_000177 [Rhizina undulata]
MFRLHMDLTSRRVFKGQAKTKKGQRNYISMRRSLERDLYKDDEDLEAGKEEVEKDEEVKYLDINISEAEEAEISWDIDFEYTAPDSDKDEEVEVDDGESVEEENEPDNGTH